MPINTIFSYFQNQQSLFLKTLNDDCLIHIFSLLTLNGLINISSTCQRLLHIAAETFRKKYSTIEFLNTNKALSHKQIKTLFLNFGHLITDLTVTFPPLSYKFQKTENLILRMTNRHCTPTVERNLNRLKIDGFEDELNRIFKDLHPIFNFLQILDINDCKIPFTCLGLLTLCSQLEELKITSCEPNKYYSDFSITSGCLDKKNYNLKKLTLKNNSPKLEIVTFMSNITSSAPNIIQLTIIEDNIIHETVKISQLKHLEYLTIDLIGTSAPNFFKILSENKTQIKSLSIIKGDFGDTFIGYLKQLQHLHTLEILVPIGLTTEDISIITNSTLPLKVLHLCEIGCDLHFRQIKNLISLTPTLQLLKLNLWDNEILNEREYMELVHLIKKRKNKKQLVIDLSESLNYVRATEYTLSHNAEWINVLQQSDQKFHTEAILEDLLNQINFGERD